VNLYPSLSVLRVGTTDGVLLVPAGRPPSASGDDPFERYSTDLLTVALEQDVDWTDALSMMMGVNINHLRPLVVEGQPAGDPLTEVNGQWALMVRHGSAVSSRYALARKSRFPTMKELYDSRLGRNVPNPDLRIRSGGAWGSGAGCGLEGVAGGISVFRSEVQDLISDVAVGDGLLQLQNIHGPGWRGSKWTQYQERWGSVGLNYAYLRAVNRSRIGTRTGFVPAGASGQRDGERARSRPGTVGGEVSYTAGQHYQNPDTRKWERLNDMTWLSVRVEHELRGGVGWYLRIDNALDAAYFSEFGVPLPGRELSVGLKVGG
jgi:outer membrane cobalamin receptor